MLFYSPGKLDVVTMEEPTRYVELNESFLVLYSPWFSNKNSWCALHAAGEKLAEKVGLGATAGSGRRKG